MKAVTLTQPWATAVARGAKRIETRSWGTRHRGWILIHAAKGSPAGQLLDLGCCWNWCAVLGTVMGGPPLSEILSFGAIIASARLVDCRPTASLTVAELDMPRRNSAREPVHLYEWTERQLGDFSPGRWAWIFDMVEPLGPVPTRGALGLWEYRGPLDLAGTRA